MVRSIARQALPLVAGAFVACTLVQVFLAGLGVFDDPASFITHREFGYLIGWFTLAILVLALLGREPRLVVGLAVLLIVQFTLQSIFVALRTSQPALAALHPVNGFLIVANAVVITRLSWAVRRARSPMAEPSPAGVTLAGAGPEVAAADVTQAAAGTGR